MDNGLAPSRAAHTITWSQAVIKNDSVVTTSHELSNKYRAKRTQRRYPGSSSHASTKRTLVHEPTSAKTTISSSHPCPSPTSVPGRHNVASCPELPSQLLSHVLEQSKPPSLPHPMADLCKDSVLAHDSSCNPVTRSLTLCTDDITFIDSRGLNPNTAVDKQARNQNSELPLSINISLSSTSDTLTTGFQTLTTWPMGRDGCEGPYTVDSMLDGVLNAASEAPQDSTFGETAAHFALPTQHVTHATRPGAQPLALDTGSKITRKPSNIGNPQEAKEPSPSRSGAPSGSLSTSYLGEVMNRTPHGSSNVHDKSQNGQASAVARNPCLKGNSTLVVEAIDNVVQPNPTSRSQFVRTFDSAAFDILIYQQKGAAPPPPSVLHTPLTNTQKRGFSINHGGRQYIHSNPAIHTMHNRSDAWYARKARDIQERGGRKFWFGKVAKRLRWLQEDLVVTRNRPTNADGRRSDPQPRTYIRSFDFADVPESELPEDVRRNPAWLKACEWFRGNKSHSQCMRAARLRELKKYEEETNNLYMSLKQDIPSWSQRYKDII